MSAPWTATALTLFPEMFPGRSGFRSPAGAGERHQDASGYHGHPRLRGKAATALIDDTPAGSGANMVMRVDVLAGDRRGDGRFGGAPGAYSAGAALRAGLRARAGGRPRRDLRAATEGVDERIFAARNNVNSSLGDFVLSGGELAAMAVMDSCVRLLPGVMGDAASHAEEEASRTPRIPALHAAPELRGPRHPAVSAAAITGGEWRKATPPRRSRNRNRRLTGGLCRPDETLNTTDGKDDGRATSLQSSKRKSWRSWRAERHHRFRPRRHAEGQRQGIGNLRRGEVRQVEDPRAHPGVRGRLHRLLARACVRTSRSRKISYGEAYAACSGPFAVGRLDRGDPPAAASAARSSIT